MAKENIKDFQKTKDVFASTLKFSSNGLLAQQIIINLVQHENLDGTSGEKKNPNCSHFVELINAHLSRF